MAGRGFLKSRIAQLKAAKEINESPKSQEYLTPQGLPNHEELSKLQDLCISQELPKPHVLTKQQDQIAKCPTVCPPSIVNGSQQPLRGRRVNTINALLKSF